MNALETYRKAADQAFRDHGMTDATLEALEAAATKYADELVRAELEGLLVNAFTAGSFDGEEFVDEMYVVSAADIDTRLAQLTAEGK